MNKPLVVAMTGASGAAYTARLLQQLLLAERSVHFTLSPSAVTVIQQEMGIIVGAASAANAAFGLEPLFQYRWPNFEDRWGPTPDFQTCITSKRLVVHHYQDYMAPIASGSFLTSGMVICPCSGATLSGVVHAAGNNLIQRAADVHLKEHRKLILVPRETPMSTFQLENLHRVSQAGAVVLPAMPGWYHGVETVVDLIDFVVARILDQLDVPHQLMKRWGTAP